mmetsp:Transcript_11501/g.18152  ORF Transcript_11501/g.18152 Transcript_11501/m.18152 type:complete len:1220 (-) Transcript_11501:93-3752(-)
MDPVPLTAFGRGSSNLPYPGIAASHGHSVDVGVAAQNSFYGDKKPTHFDTAEKNEDLGADADEHFRVVIRVRPPLERELAYPGFRNIISVTDDTQVCLHEVMPEANPGDRATGTAQVITNHPFTFDHVYDLGSSQPDVYCHTARASVLSTLQGYNATILAYGPTGTGKTYTMEGLRDDRGDEACGIIPRSMEEIFRHIRHCGPQSRFLVRASYLQIYNEVISDLLKPDRLHLQIREDRKRGVFVDGLSEWLCRSPAEVRTLMEHGREARATAQTAANDASSRSHAVFIVIIEQSDKLPESDASAKRGGESERATDKNVKQRVRVGRLNLVDLAGSERPRLTGATGQRLEETKKINQSLSALGNVIAALTERRPRAHIPYRDSKLTRLLQDSLGGNCRTTMMAMVSPAAEAFSETFSTLQFAHRAKSIRNCAQVNEDIDQRTLLRRYEAELRRLRAELRDRDRTSVDQRHLHELEEERRRAEEDRGRLVTALEERSVVLEQEKQGRQILEERIRQMSSQLLTGGGQAAAEHERIRSEYASRLAELEKERSTIEEDKAQVGRYKQLLLKQREIMIALTQRLHERDETIIALQEDIDTRDRRNAELEEDIDRRNAQLVAMENRFNVIGNSAATSEQQPTTGSVAPEWQYPPENAVFDLSIENPMKLLSASEKINELTCLLDNQRQENHRLTLEFEELQAERNRCSQSFPDWLPGSHCRVDASLEAQSLPPALALGILDRIGQGMQELVGSTQTKMRLAQDVLAMKRLLASNSEGHLQSALDQFGTVPSVSTPSTSCGGSIGGMTTGSGAPSAVAASDTQGSETSSLHASMAQNGFGHVIGIETDSLAMKTHVQLERLTSSSVQNHEVSTTLEGSNCGLSPRASNAALGSAHHGEMSRFEQQLTPQRAMSLARSEARGRRPPSLERGRGDCRPRSASREQPLNTRPSSASDAGGRASSLTSSLKNNAKLRTSCVGRSARAQVAWLANANNWASLSSASNALSSSQTLEPPERTSVASSSLEEFLRMGGTTGISGFGTASSSAPSTPHRYRHSSNEMTGPGSSSEARVGTHAWQTSLKQLDRSGTGLWNGSRLSSPSLESGLAMGLQRSASVGRIGVGSVVSPADSSGARSFLGLSGNGPVRAMPQLPTCMPKEEQAGQAVSRGVGPWFPPATAAALASAGLSSSIEGGRGSPSVTADALREEAQRSVDALLARRKAELRRSVG